MEKYLVASFESLADKITDNLASNKRENFHEFLQAYVEIFTKNVYAKTDNTYKHLKRIITDPDLVVLYNDKESYVVTMNKIDYHNKLQERINDSMGNGIYKTTEDKIFDDLKVFTSFRYQNFKKYEL